MQRDSTGTEAGIATLIKSLNLRENVASLRQGTEIRGTYKRTIQHITSLFGESEDSFFVIYYKNYFRTIYSNVGLSV